MQNESLKDFDEALDEYGVSLDQFKSDVVRVRVRLKLGDSNFKSFIQLLTLKRRKYLDLWTKSSNLWFE